MALSLEQQAIRERLKTDCPFWSKHCATILNESKQPVPLIARPWQLEFDAALEKQRLAGMPQRAIILKARKLGFSTWVQARFMQRVTQFPFQYALTIAHLQSSAGVLADMAELMYDRLPTEEQLGMGFSIRPNKIGSGRARNGNRYMTLGERERSVEASVYETGTAGAKGGGRASTPSMVHLSEAAHFEDPDYILGILNAVPKIADTIVVIESTANTFNHFHARWERAVAGAEDPDTGGMYAPLFFGWQDNPANSLAFPSDEARARFERTIGDEDEGDEEEIQLVEEFGLSLEQLRWRRVTISEECGGVLENFHQEHPATPEQAFIGSGDPVFPGIRIAKAISEAQKEPEPVQGVIRGTDWKERKIRSGSVLVPQGAIWVPASEMDDDDYEKWGPLARVRLWQHPDNDISQANVDRVERRPDSQHVVFADVAQGIGSASDDSDYSAVQVLDHMTKMQCASYDSRVPIHDLPLLLYLIGLYFNEAWLAPEVTGLGIGVLDALVQDYRYPKMYRRRRAGDDRRNDNRENLLGWSTDRRSKPLMEQAMGEAFKDGTHGLRCVKTARQFTTYVKDERGNHGAQPGSNDDLVMAYMGAQRIASDMAFRDASKKKTGKIRGYE